MSESRTIERSGLPEDLSVYAAEEELQEKAEMLAERLRIPMRLKAPEDTDTDLVLQYDREGLCLRSGELVLRADLTSMLPRIRQSNLSHELLVKAAKLKNFSGIPVAVDATAGFGEDAILLAAAGFQVKLFEYDPVIAALLGDSLERAKEVPELQEIAGRMHLTCGDSIAALRVMDPYPDVVLLDPMFPARNKSALIKKKFQLLQRLESPCSEEEDLLEAAFAAHPRKIMIKRPVKGPYLAGRKPDYTHSGKAIRYDCFSIAR